MILIDSLRIPYEPNNHLVNLSIVFATIFACIAGCHQKQEVVDRDSTQFGEVKNFIGTKDHKIHSDNIRIELDEGFYIEFFVEVNPNYPEGCSEPLLWKCDLVFLNNKDDQTEESFSPCQSLNPFTDEQFAPLSFHRPGPQIELSRDQKAPAMKKKTNETRLPFSTFIGPPFDNEGEYPYELRLYPNFKWLTASQFSPGDPVIIKKGILHVGTNDNGDG